MTKKTTKKPNYKTSRAMVMKLFENPYPKPIRVAIIPDYLQDPDSTRLILEAVEKHYVEKAHFRHSVEELERLGNNEADSHKAQYYFYLAAYQKMGSYYGAVKECKDSWGIITSHETIRKTFELYKKSGLHAFENVTENYKRMKIGVPIPLHYFTAASIHVDGKKLRKIVSNLRILAAFYPAMATEINKIADQIEEISGGRLWDVYVVGDAT